MVGPRDGVPKVNNYVLREDNHAAATFYGPAWFNPLQTAHAVVEIVSFKDELGSPKSGSYPRKITG